MIGSGSFGEVYKCMNNIGQLYAVKRLDIIKAAGKQDEAGIYLTKYIILIH